MLRILRSSSWLVASLGTLVLVACSGSNSASGTSGSGSSGGATSGGSSGGSSTGAALTWTTSYAPGGTDLAGNLMEGTEARSLVAFGGSLYAGIGYWEDSSADDPSLPGAQVLRLDSPDAAWQVDLQIDTVLKTGPHVGERAQFAIAGMAALTLTTDAAGASLVPPAEFLAATPWARLPGLRFWTRPAGPPVWTETVISEGDAGAQGRAFGSHLDSVTGVSMAFGGSDFGIFSGTYDADAGALRWNTTPETWAQLPDQDAGARVMDFSDCDGRLYTTVGAALYQRQDGPTPTWTNIYTAKLPPTSNIQATGGLRGLYCQPKPDGGSELLVAVQGPAAVLAIDPSAGFAAETEVDVRSLLSNAIGAPVYGSLLAFNDMAPATDPVTGEQLLLLGVEIYPGPSPPTSLPVWQSAVGPVVATAHYLVRHADGGYEVFGDMEDPTLASPPPRVAVRTLAISPFPTDNHAVLYGGGFDCNSTPAHNTAWILRGSLAHALGH